MKSTLIFCFFCLVSLSVFSTRINIVIRYDDFTMVNDSVNEKVIRLLHKYSIPVVLGVIPCDGNENLIKDKKYPFFDYLKEGVKRGTIEIALHGLNHKRMTPKGEFAGLSYEEQFRRIKKGKNLLDSIFEANIITYIPPFNSHDVNTSIALKANNIFIVSSSVYDVWSEAVFYPLSIDDFTQLDMLVVNNQSFGGIIVVMLHPYSFVNKGSFNELETIIKELKKNNNVHFDTFSGLEDKKIYVNNIQSQEQIKQNLLSKVLKIHNMFVTPNVILIIRVLNIILYLVVLFVFYFIWQLIVLKNHRHNAVQYSVLLMIATFISLSTYYCVLGPLKLFALFFAILFILPFLFRFFKVYDFRINFHLDKK